MSGDLPLGLAPRIAQTASPILPEVRAGRCMVSIKWFDASSRLLIVKTSKDGRQTCIVFSEDELPAYLKELTER